MLFCVFTYLLCSTKTMNFYYFHNNNASLKFWCWVITLALIITVFQFTVIPWIELPAKQTPRLVCQLTCKTGLLISTLRNFFTSVSTRTFKLLHFLLEAKPICWSGLKLASRACDFWASPFYLSQGGDDFLQPLYLSMCIYSQRLA